MPALHRALSRRSVLAGGAAALLSIQPARSAEPVFLGVSGPLTGPAAQYGAQWKKGFDLALEEVNAGGGINGRPLAIQFEDSQNDPRQSVAIAQKFEQSPDLATFATQRLGLRRVAILHLNTDWGRTSKDLAAQTVKALGGEVVATEGYLPEERDFRSTLVRVRDAHPDGVILISYYADGALIARQTRASGLNQPLVAIGSVYSPKFIELGGDAVEGVYTQSNFFPGDPRPEVKNFVQRFRERTHEEPDSFNAYAYDTIILLAAVLRQYGVSRQAVHDGLARIRDVPSVIFGRVVFDPSTRRVSGASTVNLQVKGGTFTVWDGKPAALRT